jgi:hypothetical protein
MVWVKGMIQATFWMSTLRGVSDNHVTNPWTVSSIHSPGSFSTKPQQLV